MERREKTPDDAKLFARMVAGKQGWTISGDDEFTGMLYDGLCVNWNRYGYYLCPCRDSDGSREEDAALICPCRYAHADIDEYGHCYCGLYLSIKFSESGGMAQGIPDRRFS